MIARQAEHLELERAQVIAALDQFGRAIIELAGEMLDVPIAGLSLNEARRLIEFEIMRRQQAIEVSRCLN